MAAREYGQFRKIREDWFENLKMMAWKASWINFHLQKVLENVRKQANGAYKFFFLFSVILKMLQMSNLENSERIQLKSLCICIWIISKDSILWKPT